ncbi:polysaccharide pyruvyl transferase family protein [Metabacillus elymi]|uniref:Polysaccharide pyruvyl transferase family protein n=1 Tax=Metabacillus elymi TaxID=2745198 RepID=A0ABX6RYE0_9BACI|nr:polysaccharide pyruvyl transferase family protein [Metabacillus sp. KUDC1714]QNF26188.1 polysaccharide pyruvyl transferase family protein [Metabacillus sp. KUDC1714]
MKKKILVNAYFAKNLGDDLFLKVLFDRYPDVEWYLLTSDKSYKEIFSRYNKVKIIKSLSLNIGKREINLFYKINDILLKYKKYDAYLIIGGSIFMEFPSWEEKLKHREYLPNKFKELNKQTFIIGSNFGPFTDDTFIEKHKEFFNKFDDICFRDKYSYNLFNDLNNVRVSPDVVFNLETKSSNKKEKVVGISLIDIEKRKNLQEFYNNYNKKVIELIEKFIDVGYSIKLFSFCENEGDLRISNYIKSKVKNSNNIKVINYDGDIDEFLNQFKTCEVIVGTRFHSIILGILFDLNVFSIIYSEKTYNVLRDLNLNTESNYCYIKNIQELDVETVIFKENKIENRVVLKKAEEQFKSLDIHLGYS